MFKGLPSKSVGMDLMLVDIPEDLAILEVSNPDGSIPAWNKLALAFLDTIFDFTNIHIHNNGALLVIHADAVKIKTNLKCYLKAEHFKVFKEWMGINLLRLTCGREPSKTLAILVLHLILIINFMN
jgi:hypothetical protein